MPLRLITAPTAEPVTYLEAKDQLRLEHDLDQTFVERLITAARAYVEQVAWRGLVTQTWELVLPCFPEGDSEGGVELPRGNLLTVGSVKYVDGNGVEQTLATTEYVVDTASVPGRILLAYGKTWPSTREQWDAVKIRYDVGYSVANVPQPIKQAVLLLVSQMYEHRTPEVTGPMISVVQLSFKALLSPYRLLRID